MLGSSCQRRHECPRGGGGSRLSQRETRRHDDFQFRRGQRQPNSKIALGQGRRPTAGGEVAKGGAVVIVVSTAHVKTGRDTQERARPSPDRDQARPPFAFLGLRLDRERWSSWPLSRREARPSSNVGVPSPFVWIPSFDRDFSRACREARRRPRKRKARCPASKGPPPTRVRTRSRSIRARRGLMSLRGLRSVVTAGVTALARMM